MLDSLRLLHKENDINATLRTSLSDVAILQHKKLWTAAARQLRKTKKLALETSRYTYVLQCIEAELVQVKQLPPDQASAAYAQLQAEEQQAIAKHETLRELQFRHDSILALAQQYPFSRNTALAEKADAFADAERVNEQLYGGSYLEHALVTNTLGIRDLFRLNPDSAIERYRRLFDLWKTKSEWQIDQPDLLITICKCYQNACFYSTVNPGLVHANLMSLKGFEGLPPDKLRAFRETIFHHRFIHSLNSGNLDLVLEMIPEIEEWLREEAGHISESQLLPFLCNFLVAEFLSENFNAANRLITRIVNVPNRKTRVDIREFALVLQPVVQYELENDDLNEYLTRSRKRHFSKSETGSDLGMTVLRNIEQLLRAGSAHDQQLIFTQFITGLEKLSAAHGGSIPLLGLNEIYMWAVSRKNKIPLREVFMEEVRKAHALAAAAK